jgi:hypothetical protein
VLLLARLSVQDGPGWNAHGAIHQTWREEPKSQAAKGAPFSSSQSRVRSQFICCTPGPTEHAAARETECCVPWQLFCSVSARGFEIFPPGRIPEANERADRKFAFADIRAIEPELLGRSHCFSVMLPTEEIICEAQDQPGRRTFDAAS